MPTQISPNALAELRSSGAPHALLDVREPGEYNTAHIPGSLSLPRRMLELRIERLVPFPDTPLAVCDDDGRCAALAAATLEQMGYTDVRVLDGGLNHWTTDGRPTEWGANVASKDFGEMIYEREGVPEVTAHELDLWMSEGRDILLLDSRTPEEHSAATIPSSRSMPGGELALRIHGLERGPSTTVVVHCAGRTRSIVGARTLIRMGIENVYALRNGTMGWRMAGLDLEVGSHRTELPEPADADRELAGARARTLAEAEGVAFVDVDGLREIESTTSQENVYLIDVRTREEFEGGHVPGFRWFPGGQLLQRTDEAIGVREASAVLACDGLARAAMTAAWLAQMGFPHVRVLDGGTQAWTADGGELETGLEMSWPTIIRQALDWARAVEADDLRVEMAGSEPPILLSVGTSHEFARGHLPGSTWAPRGSLELRIGGIASSLARPLVVTSLDEAQAALSARALIAMGYESVRVLAGGIATWRAAGGCVERGLSGVMSPPQDILPAGTERSWAEMMQYLTWEEALGHKYRDG